MRTRLNNHLHRSWPVLALAALLFGLRPVPAQMVDLNSNGMSDIWELIFNAGGLSPNADADADGASNKAEATAGTDPTDPNSVAKISTFSSAAGVFSVTMPCALGKQYQLQSSTVIGSTSNWTVEATQVVRSGSFVTLAASTT